MAPLGLECYHVVRMGGLVKATMQVGRAPPFLEPVRPGVLSLGLRREKGGVAS